MGGLFCGLLLNSMGGFWYLQSRVTRSSWIEEGKSYIPAGRQAAHGWAWRVLPEVWLEKAAAAFELERHGRASAGGASQLHLTID
jgi:hypothetical protein